jgi:hypothetical protein
MSESRVTYEYDGTGRLASAAYLDGTVVRYSGASFVPHCVQKTARSAGRSLRPMRPSARRVARAWSRALEESALRAASGKSPGGSRAA